MLLGISLMPYSEKQINQLNNISDSMGISCFEIPHGKMQNYESVKDKKIYSIHANKNCFELHDKEFTEYLMTLESFARQFNCKRLLFHPHEDWNITKQKLSIIHSYSACTDIILENTIQDMDRLMATIQEYDYRITIDFAHAAYHRHDISKYLEFVEYFHVRGYNSEIRYVPLAKDASYFEKIKLPENGVYILEYPYVNTVDIMKDVYKLRKMVKG